MKRAMQVWVSVVLWASCMAVAAQPKMDERRMEQDIEVAENILSTLIRQQFDRRNFFPTEVNGSYLAGYGVTFRLPQSGPFNGFMKVRTMGGADMVNITAPGAYTYTFSTNGQSEEREAMERDVKQREEEVMTKATREKQRTTRTSPKVAVGGSGQNGKSINVDSMSVVMDKKFMEIAKNFLADYGDVLSQLRPEERIVITNRMDEFGASFNYKWGGESRRSLLSVETKRDDITQLKQGKMSRDQFISKLAIVNTQTADKLDPDLEVLSSMFSRLYREDLSKTYYAQGDVPYDRMKDFGVIYYMRVYSSNGEGEDRWSMPTVGLSDVSQAERDKKVKELYPAFESELKENIIEYGRTLRSLKDDEQVMFNVKLTKCTGCGIPASIEVSVKFSALKDYASGKASKEATLAKVNVKKSGNQ